MVKKRVKSALVNALKIAISALAVWFVLSKINIGQLKTAFADVRWIYLVVATIFFAASKAVSAVRLNIYFRNVDVELSERDNLKLYLLGMFYNLFLPGGIGGDGYKVWLLHREGGYSFKRLTFAVLLDRVNGMIAIVLLMLLTIFFMPVFGPARFASPLVMLILLVGYAIAVRHMFPYFSGSVGITTNLSVGVQLLQVLSVLFIMAAVQLHGRYIDMVFIFMVSSVVAVLPFTIGGVGAREIVFLYGSAFFGINPTVSVVVSFIFFLITATVSLVGIYYSIGTLHITLKNISHEESPNT